MSSPLDPLLAVPSKLKEPIPPTPTDPLIDEPVSATNTWPSRTRSLAGNDWGAEPSISTPGSRSTPTRGAFEDPARKEGRGTTYRSALHGARVEGRPERTGARASLRALRPQHIQSPRDEGVDFEINRGGFIRRSRGRPCAPRKGAGWLLRPRPRDPRVGVREAATSPVRIGCVSTAPGQRSLTLERGSSPSLDYGEVLPPLTEPASYATADSHGPIEGPARLAPSPLALRRG